MMNLWKHFPNLKGRYNILIKKQLFLQESQCSLIGSQGKVRQTTSRNFVIEENSSSQITQSSFIRQIFYHISQKYLLSQYDYPNPDTEMKIARLEFINLIGLQKQNRKQQMKAYRVEGVNLDSIFYVGHKDQIAETLNKHFNQPPSPTMQSALNRNLSKSNQLSSKLSFLTDQSSQSTEKHSIFLSKKIEPSHQYPSIKSVSLYLLIFDIQISEYNTIQSQINSAYKNQSSNADFPTTIHLVQVESRQQSLKFIKKITKYTEPEFQSNLFALNQQLQENIQNQMVKSYISQKFGYSKEEVFQWQKQTNIKDLDALFRCKVLPGYQRKQIQKLVRNLALLEGLYQNDN